MALRFTKAADADIVHMMLEGIERFGLSQADVYADGLKAACRAIQDNPEVGRRRVAGMLSGVLIVIALGSLAVRTLMAQMSREGRLSRPCR